MRIWEDFKLVLHSISRQRLITWLGLVLAVASATATQAGAIRSSYGLVLSLMATLVAAAGPALRETQGNEWLSLAAVVLALANTLSGFGYLCSPALLTWLGIVSTALAAFGKSLFTPPPNRGGTFGGTMKRTQVFSLLALCLLILCAVGCAKKIAGEAPEVTKARKSAIYSAQAFVSLDAWSDATEIIANGQQLSRDAARASYGANETARKAADQITAFLKAGKPKDALDAIDRVLKQIEEAEASQIYKFKTPAARQEFSLALSGVRLAFESIRAAIENTREPDVSNEKGLLAAQDQTGAAWWVELVRLGSNTYSRLYRISRFSTAEQGWNEAVTVSGILASKNAARLGT